jgi:hypothetical protein
VTEGGLGQPSNREPIVDREAVIAGFEQGHPTESERRSRGAKPGARIGNDQQTQTGSAAHFEGSSNWGIRQPLARRSLDAAVRPRGFRCRRTVTSSRFRSQTIAAGAA